MSAQNDVLFPHSQTLFFEDQSAIHQKENSPDILLRADLLHHESGNGSLCELLLPNSKCEPPLQNCEHRQDESFFSYAQKVRIEPLFGLWEIGDSCRTQDHRSICNMPEISTNLGACSFDASLCRTDTGCQASLIGKPGTSSRSEAIPAHERLSYLSLQQIVETLDMEESGSLPSDADTHFQPVALTGTAAEMHSLSPSNFSSSLICISDSGGSAANFSYATDLKPPELTVQTIVGSDCALESKSLIQVTDDLLPASLLTRSAADMIEIEPVFIGDESQQRVLPFNSLSSRLSLPDEGVLLASTEDGLSPLPVSTKSSLRPYTIQRSLSSHALGQTIAKASSQEPLLVTSDPLHRPKSFQDTQDSMQPYPFQLQANNSRPMMPSMRRVYSTGDIKTFGQSSPSLPECFSQEDGKSKIGRYSSEERKVRISRYRQKRAERNFNKKIKYVCRKTLADNRPRVRGRFARNDDVDQAGHEAKVRRQCEPDGVDLGEYDISPEEEGFDEYISRNSAYMLKTKFTFY